MIQHPAVQVLLFILYLAVQAGVGLGLAMYGYKRDQKALNERFPNAAKDDANG